MTAAALVPHVPVTALPHIVTTRGRLQLTVPAGSSVREIIAAALPDLPPARLGWVRVLVGDRIVAEAAWGEERPGAGVPVVVQVLPAGGDGLRSVLSIVVTVAALALGQIWAVPLAGALGVSSAVAGGIITGATLFAGQLLINALVPQPKAKDTDQTRRYSIDGMRNTIAPDAPVPLVLGTRRWAPPYAALPYTEEIGDDLWWTGVFCLGYGPLAVSDPRIGDTPLSHYADVQTEIRQGLPGDAPLSLYSQQVHEQALSVELSHDVGPVTRVSGGDASRISVQLTFPGGLYRTTKKGTRATAVVEVRIRARLAGTAVWEEITRLWIERAEATLFRVSHSWEPPVRGRYEIEVYRWTGDIDDSSYSDIVTWTALRTFRPEYPWAMPADRPLAFFAIRMRASKQLQGALEDLTVLTSSIAPEWDAGAEAWVERETRAPASHVRRLLQGPQLTYPLDDADLDLPGLAAWAEHCAPRGLTYDAVITDERSLGDVIREVALLGRARPDDRGDVWGVVVDREVPLITTAITERNAWGIRKERSRTRFPDAVRVKFLDRDSSYKEATRVIPWIGFTGTPSVTEEWEAPGITDAALAWTWARRRMRELIHRPVTYYATQAIEHLVVAPGSRVLLGSRVLRSTMQVAQLRRARGTLLWLDTAVTRTAGVSYRIRVRAADGSTRTADLAPAAEDVAGDAIRTAVALDPPPAAGDIVLIGPVGEETIDAVVQNIESGEDLTAILTLVAHAPEIDVETDADIPPPWDGRAGGEVVSDTRDPLAPRILAIESGYQRAGDPSEILVRLAPASADPVPVARYDVRHRSAGAPSWSEISAAISPVRLTGYGAGQHVEISAAAISVSGRTGPWCAAVEHTVLPADAPGPEVASLTLTRLASGAVRIAWAVESGAGYIDQVAARLRYRAGTAPVGETWGWTDLDPLHAGLLLSSPYTTTALPDGAVTIGVRAEDADGLAGPPLIGVHDVRPLAPRAISATAEDDDVRVAVTLQADLTAAAVRIYRSLQAAAADTEIDVSGALDAAPSARVVWLDEAPPSGPWRYRARAETADGVQSPPSSEATP